MEQVGGKFDGLLSPSQQNHLLTTLRHADQLLCDCEQILASGGSLSPFPSYAHDFNDQERAVLSSLISRLRGSFMSTLLLLGVSVPAPRISALRAIQTNLDYIDMDLEELRPGSMKGYGPLAERAADRLETAVQDIQSDLRVMLRYLRTRDPAP